MQPKLFSQIHSDGPLTILINLLLLHYHVDLIVRFLCAISDVLGDRAFSFELGDIPFAVDFDICHTTRAHFKSPLAFLGINLKIC